MNGSLDNSDQANPQEAGYEASLDRNAERRERLRKLALETIASNNGSGCCLRNSLGTYECKLCLTLHQNEASYLAHTQAKRHQRNLLAKKEQEGSLPIFFPATVDKGPGKIEKPEYAVDKMRDPGTGQQSLVFKIKFPGITEHSVPTYKVTPCDEQTIQGFAPQYQYILFAAEPYETFGFKIPNMEIDQGQDKTYSEWDVAKKTYTLHLSFKIDL